MTQSICLIKKQFDQSVKINPMMKLKKKKDGINKKNHLDPNSCLV
jgi:hypothetical protein